eukprot:Hpha_TRINITY_DN13148_c0_g1::TRINITY_DN13148_c0_g1_i1::g.113812::m.113812
MPKDKTDDGVGTQKEDAEGLTLALNELIGDAAHFNEERARARKLLLKEIVSCLMALLLFGCCLAHCWIYPAVFNVKQLSSGEVPQSHIDMASQMATAIGVLLSVQFAAVLLKLAGGRRHPVLQRLGAQSMSGVLGNVMSCLLLVMMSNIVIATNIAPVFVESRTNRLVYPTRYIQWMLTAPEMIIFSFRFLFNKPAMSWRCVASCCTIGPCIVFGLWGAISNSWGLFWFFTSMAWCTFFLAVYFFWKEFMVSIADDSMARYGSSRTKKVILSVSFFLWSFIGLWYMVAFLTDNWLPLDVEFKGYALADVLLKLFMIVMNMAFDESRWAIRNAMVSYAMVSRTIDQGPPSPEAPSANPLRPAPSGPLQAPAVSAAPANPSPPGTGTMAASSSGGEQSLPAFGESVGEGKEGTRRVDLLFQMIPRTQEKREEEGGQSKSIDKSGF